MSAEQVVVLTGAAGLVGRLVRPLLRRPGRSIRLVDIADVDSGPGETFMRGSFTDAALAQAACEGATSVIHLGGISKENTWDEILRTNVGGTKALLDASASAGVESILLASSLHAVGYLTPDEIRTGSVADVRPDTYYGWSKAAVEALGSLYADRFGLTVVSARIGTVVPAVENPRMTSTWLSPGDMARLAEAVIALRSRMHHIVWALSRNSAGFVDHTFGEAIGFHPVDDGALGTFARDPSLDAKPVGGPFLDPRHPLGVPWSFLPDETGWHEDKGQDR